jgi:hypothetical protein
MRRCRSRSLLFIRQEFFPVSDPPEDHAKCPTFCLRRSVLWLLLKSVLFLPPSRPAHSHPAFGTDRPITTLRSRLNYRSRFGFHGILCYRCSLNDGAERRRASAIAWIILDVLTSHFSVRHAFKMLAVASQFPDLSQSRWDDYSRARRRDRSADVQDGRR